MDEGVWQVAPWSASYGDIQGQSLPDPRFSTRMKMLWDESHLYIGVEMEEPDLWATYTEHDQIVFHENDFEIFIDPTGDAREYYEIEVNVLGTIFDLYLYNAYRDGGPAEHGWDCTGLRTAISVDGTVNDPSDRDRGWTLEWAIPFASLIPPTERIGNEGPERARSGSAPGPWETWRINFSRVQWHLDVVDGAYVKRPDTPEDNWTWSPQWEINMHVPQHWGYVRFLPKG
ncbi:MAG: carbohydrate-binding family 9-like protein [Planctomycetota bacterium]|nr:carbohydrate-binding family 9-like protein [Planctomycetota bacterium]